MVVCHDAMPEQVQDTLQSVADAGGADVADVHRLGNVGRAEVHHDAAGRGGLAEE